MTNSGTKSAYGIIGTGLRSCLTTDGPEKNTLQWAPDGINFEIQAVIKGAPHAVRRPFPTPDHDTAPPKGLRWALCHIVDGQSGYMERFEVSEVLKDQFLSKSTCE